MGETEHARRFAPGVPPKGAFSPTDSGWFWLMVFSLAALAALVAVNPKHYARQERLERMRQSRDDLARRGAAGEVALQLPDAGAPPAEGASEQSYTTLPLVVALTVVAAISIAMVVRAARHSRTLALHSTTKDAI